MSKHTKKWILEHYECEGQTDLSDFLPFNDTDVDNFVTGVDNISEPVCNIYVCVRCSLAPYCFPKDA